MKPLHIVTLCLLVFLTSCGVHRHQPATVVKDSVRVEYRERLVRDTVEYELPVIVEKHVTDDTLSVIENDYAKTTAVVRNGHLSHDLQTKPAVIRVPVAVPVHDTLYIEKSAEIRTQTVEVEKQLSQWQAFLIIAGGMAVAAVLLLVIFVAVKNLILRSSRQR